MIEIIIVAVVVGAVGFFLRAAYLAGVERGSAERATIAGRGMAEVSLRRSAAQTGLAQGMERGAMVETQRAYRRGYDDAKRGRGRAM